MTAIEMRIGTPLDHALGPFDAVLSSRLALIDGLPAPSFLASDEDPDAASRMEQFGAPVGNYEQADVDVRPMTLEGPHGAIHVRTYLPQRGSRVCPRATTLILPRQLDERESADRWLKFAPELDDVHPEVLLEAAVPVLKALATERAYTRLAVFGSVARHQARQDSDIDLLVEAPEGTSSFGFIRFKQLIEQVLGREIDLVSYGGLKPKLDDDIRREAVLL